MRLTELRRHRDLVEQIEKATLRTVFHALADSLDEASSAFAKCQGVDPDVLAEELLRAALDRVGMPFNYAALPGRVDYKKARWFFHPDFAVRQALMVDAKAEKTELNFSIQSGQTSMRVRFCSEKTKKAVKDSDGKFYRGKLPWVIGEHADPSALLTTTIVAKFMYAQEGGPANTNLYSARCNSKWRVIPCI